jgi:hypothetical protein
MASSDKTGGMILIRQVVRADPSWNFNTTIILTGVSV